MSRVPTGPDRLQLVCPLERQATLALKEPAQASVAGVAQASDDLRSDTVARLPAGPTAPEPENLLL